MPCLNAVMYNSYEGAKKIAEAPFCRKIALAPGHLIGIITNWIKGFLYLKWLEQQDVEKIKLTPQHVPYLSAKQLTHLQKAETSDLAVLIYQTYRQRIDTLHVVNALTKEQRLAVRIYWYDHMFPFLNHEMVLGFPELPLSKLSNNVLFYKLRSVSHQKELVKQILLELAVRKDVDRVAILTELCKAPRIYLREISELLLTFTQKDFDSSSVDQLLSYLDVYKYLFSQREHAPLLHKILIAIQVKPKTPKQSASLKAILTLEIAGQIKLWSQSLEQAGGNGVFADYPQFGNYVSIFRTLEQELTIG